jgi:hypothetical protein
MKRGYYLQGRLLFVQHESLEIVSNPGFLVFVYMTIKITFEDLKLVPSKSFEMDWSLTYIGSSLSHWMAETNVLYVGPYT